nr:MAG TPA: prohead serine protease [Caudoviricetes sp.]
MKETRNAALNAATDTDEAGGMILTGTPIVFDQPTTINTPDGSYTEIIAAGALDGCDLSDSRLLWAHDDKRVPLARTPRTMTFNVDAKGLHMTAQLPDTEEARSVYEAIKRRDVQGMSFAFVVAPGGDEWSADGTTRTINKISKVLEVSAVNFPAYPTASIEARAARQATQRQAAARRNAILMANIIISKTI